MYTNDIPCCDEGKIATFAEVTAIFTTGKNTEEAKIESQEAIDRL